MRVSAKYKDHNTDLPADFVPVAVSAILSSFAHAGSSLIIGFCSLFGILLNSQVIVLCNSLLLLIIRHIARRLLASSEFPIDSDQKSYYPIDEVLPEQCSYPYPDVRAPPLLRM